MVLMYAAAADKRLTAIITNATKHHNNNMDPNNHKNISTDLANATSALVAAAAKLASIADKGDSAALDVAIWEVQFASGDLITVQNRVRALKGTFGF
jgi:hypothetical protein